MDQYESEKEFLCGTCYESVSLEEAIIMGDCGHGLCTECFQWYCEEKVRAGTSCSMTLCPVQPCGNLVSAMVFEKCLEKELWQKYKRFLISSFVEASYNAKWCPGKGCTMIVANKLGTPVEVQCSCGTRFCYGCLKAPHPPISCELVEKWLEVCEEERDIEAELNA